MDKLWWNEQWMGWPLGPHYAASSNVDNAHRLRGKLLLIVGEMDTNVDPSSTYQVVNALMKADKKFDLLVVPGAGTDQAAISDRGCSVISSSTACSASTPRIGTRSRRNSRGRIL